VRLKVNQDDTHENAVTQLRIGQVVAMRLPNRMRARNKGELQAASIVRSITGLPRRTAWSLWQLNNGLPLTP